MSQVTLSANTLFHFTNSVENIESILMNEFIPKYCLEDLGPLFSNSGTYERIFFALPMVCFCDIPLSQIKNHINLYGGYAVGLSKEWGVKNAINPVLYTLPKTNSSLMLSGINDTLLKYNEVDISSIKFKSTKSAIEDINNIIRNFIGLISCMKAYEGLSFRNGKLTDDIIRFYDEREWRYIPDINHLETPPFLSIEEYNSEEKRIEYNSILSKSSRLSFEPSDIKYIIVKSENEVFDMGEKIKRIKEKFSYRDVQILITRIISCEQILEDF